MIVIAGDSWGCGEWEEKTGKILHFGLTEYLRQDGHTVINLSKGGGSNLRMADTLHQFCPLHLDVEKIFIFQTEWTRDTIEENSWSKEFCQLVKEKSPDVTLKIRDQVLTRFYSILAGISLTCQIPIYLIGGLSDIDFFPDFNREFPGIVPICKSSINLVLFGDDEVEDPTTTCFSLNRDIVPLLKKNCKSNKELESVLNEVDKANKRSKLMHENPKYFYPDGGHGNRLYHKILYDYIKTKQVI